MKKNDIKIVDNAEDLPDQVFEDLSYCHDIIYDEVDKLLRKYDRCVVLNALGSCFTNAIFELIDKEILEEYVQSASFALQNAIKNKIDRDKEDETKTS